MENLIIVGTGTNAVHAFEFIKMYDLYNVIGFAVNKEYITEPTFRGLPVYDLEKIQETVKEPFKIFISLLWNRLNKERRNLFEWCDSRGFDFANIISPHAVMRPSSRIGRNCWIHDFVVLQHNTVIGDDVAIMGFALIGGNSKVGSHSFLGAKSIIGGGSKVGEQCFIGINATIFDCTSIGEKCIVGACTHVKRNLPSYSVVKTAMDSVSITQYREEEIENKLQFRKNVR